MSQKNLYVPGQNAFLNVQTFDNIIDWTLEMLHSQLWIRNQFYSSVTLTTLVMQHWRQRHIVNYALGGLQETRPQKIHIELTVLYKKMSSVPLLSREQMFTWPRRSIQIKFHPESDQVFGHVPGSW